MGDHDNNDGHELLSAALAHGIIVHFIFSTGIAKLRVGGLR